ncbi:MAG: PilC/PilY family type IV pilus protein [Fluviicoccus sp.]|nr:PilC/PilY family type IV pilus protein [Fluviicoccus sp.]MDO8331473.1 PilC/PilY family type IV pilus protein [Fluviicoccus sp.]
MSKHSNKKNWQMSVAGFSYVSLAIAPVYASDVEIYTQAISSSALSPVVMMMLDTSGSMAYCVDSTSTSSCGTTAKRRDQVLKAAVKEVLTGASPAPGYVKMGLSRYQNDGDDGGWVVYPARPLDALVAIAPDGVVTNGVTSSSGDTGPGGLTATTLTIAGGVGNEGGLYFPKVMVPKGASIRSAHIELVAKNSDSSAATWQMSIEDTGNAQIFSTTNPLSSSSRPFKPATMSIEMESWTAGNTYSVDVRELVQEVAGNRSDWCGGNAMSFRLRETGAGQRRAYSWDADSNLAARLVVDFAVDPTATDSCLYLENQVSYFYTGMLPTGVVDTAQAKRDDVRWDDGSTSVGSSTDTSLSYNSISSGKKRRIAVRMTTANPVPKDATINSATFRVTAASTTSSKDTALYFFKQANMPAICTSSGCTKPADTVDKLSPVQVWPARSFSTDQVVPIAVNVSNLSPIINGAASSQVTALTMLMLNNTTTTSAAAIRSADNSIQKAPYLEVNWSGTITDLTRMTTVRKELVDIVNALPANANTPLADAYADSARYLLGLTPHTVNDGDSNIPLPPDSRTMSGTKFRSPVNTSDQCSGNYIFLLTDGEPNGLADVQNNMLGKAGEWEGITGRACTVPAGTTVTGTADVTDWKCMMDLADTMSNTTKNPLGVSVKTNSVFLGPDASAAAKSNMGKVATLGGGNFYTAANTQDLVDALTRTITDAISNTGLIASPGVAVNQFNRLNSLDQVYYVLFDPTRASKRWNGNLKRYKLDVGSDGVLDVNGIPAVNGDGSFKRDSQSFWSAAPDGNDSTSGGAAGMLPYPTDRNIFTYVDSSKPALDKVDTASSSFVSAALPLMPAGANTTSVFTNLINWYKGFEVEDIYGPQLTAAELAAAGERKKIGGGLHSRASLVNYGFTGTDAANAANQKNILFFSTLGATLHGIEANTGVEKFAFIPAEKLPVLKLLYDNPGSVEPEYGLDLTWTLYRKDTNADGQINGAGGDKLYAYGGMRMGGRNYYALDLTSITTPKMLFTLKGGTGAYTNMGQTWSQPVLADIKVGATVKKVLVFGGGYDECWEDSSCGSTQLGNQLYIVDAETGELIWWASGAGAPSATPAAFNVTAMSSSIPSQPKVMDINSDGLADTIYFGDLGGQLFRADIVNGNGASALVKRVKVVAQLGSNGVSGATAADGRRIYEPPSVALFRDETMKKIFAAVAVGTGNRSRPLNMATQDRFAVLFDYDMGRSDLLTATAASLQGTLKFSNLISLDLATDTSTGTPTYTLAAGKYTPNSYGWYVNLSSGGEKSLSPGIIFLKKLMFTTYLPLASQTGCSVVVGYTNLYQMCMPYGNKCDAATPRKSEGIIPGLGGEPQLVYQSSNVADTTASCAEPPCDKLKVLISTKLSEEEAGLKKQLQNLRRWREKTRQ